jgi:hypothetical protein
MRRSSFALLLGVVISIAAASPSHAAAGGVAYAPPGFVWGKTSVSNTAVFGYRGHREGYSWSVGVGSDTNVCVQGWGFDAAHPRGGWFGLGCGSSGGGTVPWGNVLAMPKLRAKSYAIFMGAAVPWRH